MLTTNKTLAKRYTSNLIDYTLIFILTFFYVYLVGNLESDGKYRVTGFKAFVIPGIWFLYFPLAESLFGKTLGKKALNLQVIDSAGESPALGQAFVRRLTDVIELAFIGIPALILMSTNSENKRLGDFIAGTTVIDLEEKCKSCHAKLCLSTQDVLNKRFSCPACNELIESYGEQS
ncbi:MAG TPA: RDD family protein [Cytophagales bacterium]|nr:RDD family protein [Cytophagales bacterium]